MSGAISFNLVRSFRKEDERVFNNKRLSDAIVKCGDREWPVHKSVVCNRSTWFDKALNSGMQVSHGPVVVSDQEASAH